MSKVLALDIGEKRVGIAISDDTGSFAFPRKAIQADDSFFEKVDSMVKKEGVDKIVVGLPRNMDGTLGEQADVVEDFVEKRLGKYKQVVEFEDETATTLLAEEELRREGLDPRSHKDLIDSYAAKIILESWLRNQGSGS